MVRGRHVYSSCIIHERKEVGKRGLKMTLVVGRGLLAPPPLFRPTQCAHYMQRIQCYRRHLQGVQDAAVK